MRDMIMGDRRRGSDFWRVGGGRKRDRLDATHDPADGHDRNTRDRASRGTSRLKTEIPLDGNGKGDRRGGSVELGKEAHKEGFRRVRPSAQAQLLSTSRRGVWPLLLRFFF